MWGVCCEKKLKISKEIWQMWFDQKMCLKAEKNVDSIWFSDLS